MSFDTIRIALTTYAATGLVMALYGVLAGSEYVRNVYLRIPRRRRISPTKMAALATLGVIALWPFMLIQYLRSR